MQIKRTSNVHTDGIKALVYSASGAGKTTLCATLPNPIILSAEAGLLSIADADLPYIEISTMADLREAYMWLTKSEEAKQFQSVALDSISEIAEVLLAAEKKLSKDGRMAYGNMGEQMTDLIRAFRDLSGKHVYFSAKMEKMQDENGKIIYGPSMPGNKLGQNLPYFFDEVFVLRTEKMADGTIQRMLMCQPDGSYIAKDRSGKLDQWEKPHMGEIICKISS